MPNNARPSVGAYVLTGDPTWLASSLSRYYDLLDDLVVLVPDGRVSWSGRPLPVDACIEAIRAVDSRGLARIVTGRWTDPVDVLAAENAERAAGLAALSHCDWVLQVDNDELMPHPSAVAAAIEQADELGLPAVEWPMRCLYRGLRGSRFLQVVGVEGRGHYEWPGPVAVRPDVELIDCRRTSGTYLRLVVEGDTRSLQLRQEGSEAETRSVTLQPADAIIHNTWGRSPRTILAKLRSSSHRLGARGLLYFVAVWLPSPLTWRWLRNVHPFADGLWPRLAPTEIPADLLHEHDRG